MDPITSAVIWLVVWFFIREAIAVAGLIFFLFIGSFIAATIDRAWPAVVGLILGWLFAIGFSIFSIIQVVLEIITIVGLVNA